MEYKVFDNNRRNWVLADGVPLAALLFHRHQATAMRPYLFPFCTPAGKNLLQDCPPNHPHHQGICVG